MRLCSALPAAALIALSLMQPASAQDAVSDEAAISDDADVSAGDSLRGQALAENLCSGCHALDAGAASPNPDAPNFHALDLAYPPEYLAEGFAEGIVVGTDAHIGMPQFELAPDQIDDLIAYLDTVLPPVVMPGPMDETAAPETD